MTSRELIAAGIGLAVAAVVPPLLLVTLPVDAQAHWNWADRAGWFLVFSIASTAVIVAFGLPAFSVLRRFNRARLWSTLLTGAVGGGLIANVLRISDWHWDAGTTMAFSGMGAASALSFWSVWKLLGQPRRDGNDQR